MHFPSVAAVGTTLLALTAAPVAAVPYRLTETLSNTNFFDGFNFFTAPDPTHGYVSYKSRVDARTRGLISLRNRAAYIGVDSTNRYNDTAVGRPSVRITTKKAYTRGLFVLDLAHMPGNECGIWPAFWSLGSGTWPNNGEIDIIEGVNNQVMNKVVGHTSDNCRINGLGQTGRMTTNNCAVSFSTTGCSSDLTQANSFGDRFNANGGGIYAMEWATNSIKVWFFPRNNIPAAVRATNPNPANFGTPSAVIAGPNCNISQKFRSHSFIFNTAFCGDWAGNAYQGAGCPMYAGLDTIRSCVRYVGQNPTRFTDAYWLINSFKTYVATTPVKREAEEIEAEIVEEALVERSQPEPVYPSSSEDPYYTTTAAEDYYTSTPVYEPEYTTSTPVYEPEYPSSTPAYEPQSTYANGEPSEPEYTPGYTPAEYPTKSAPVTYPVPTYEAPVPDYPVGNETIGVYPTGSVTTTAAPAFTGAASKMVMGGWVAGLGAVMAVFA